MTVRFDSKAAGEDSGLNERPLVSVVMPCLNEDRTVGECVRKALSAIAELDVPGEVVVSDNGSTDQSVVEAERAGARVVHCDQRGYGNALRFGIQLTLGDLIVMGDADGSYDFNGIARFIHPLQEGADLVMGNRFLGGIRPGAMPWKNRYIGNPVLTGILNLFFHTGIGDAHCGLRAISRNAYERLHLECSGMEFASEMVVKAAKRELRIVEVPTTLDPDGRNRAPHLAPWRDGWRHLKFLLMFSPLHLFLIPGVVLAVIGLLLLLLPVEGVWRIAGLRFDVHWMVLGVFVLTVGVQIVQFGIVAKLYTVVHRFREHDPTLEWLRSRFRCEYGVLLGIALFVIGFGIDSWVLWSWIGVRFGPLEQVRPALVATALMVVGVQFFFFSFLVAIISPAQTTIETVVGSTKASIVADDGRLQASQSQDLIQD